MENPYCIRTGPTWILSHLSTHFWCENYLSTNKSFYCLMLFFIMLISCKTGPMKCKRSSLSQIIWHSWFITWNPSLSIIWICMQYQQNSQQMHDMACDFTKHSNQDGFLHHVKLIMSRTFPVIITKLDSADQLVWHTGGHQIWHTLSISQTPAMGYLTLFFGHQTQEQVTLKLHEERFLSLLGVSSHYAWPITGQSSSF